MSLRIQAKVLKAALTAAGGSLGETSDKTVPILQHFKIEAERGGDLVVTACDYDCQATSRVNADVVASFACTAPGKILAAMVSKLPPEAQVELVHDTKGNARARAGAGSAEQSGARLHLACNKVKLAVETLDAADFPSIEATKDAPKAVRIAADALVRAFDAVSFCCGNDPARHNLLGVNIAARDGRLQFVATNGHRLAITEGEATIEPGMPSIIVPRASVAELVKHAKALGGELTLLISKARVVLEAPGLRFVSKLIDLEFPAWERVMPGGTAASVVTLPRALTAAAVDRVAIVLERTDPVSVEIEGGALKVHALNRALGMEGRDWLNVDVALPGRSGASPDAAAGRSDAGADAAAGDVQRIGFNPRYLGDILGHIEADDVDLHLYAPGAPALLTAASGAHSAPAGTAAGAASRYVLMPMRL